MYHISDLCISFTKPAASPPLFASLSGIECEELRELVKWKSVININKLHLAQKI